MATSALRLQQLYNRKQNYALSIREVSRPLALRASCQLLTVFVLVGLVCKLGYLKATEYILDDSGQLIEMPLLAAEGLQTSTIFVDIDGENCDFYEDDWCQRYGGIRPVLACHVSNAGHDGLLVQVA